MTRKKRNEMVDAATDTMKVGVVSMAGMGALGAMAAMPGMPAAAAGIVPVAGAGMTLANTGQMLKTTKTVVGVMSDKPAKKF